jgi:DNA primase large subunit
VSYKGRFELCLFLKAAGFDYFSQYRFWKDLNGDPESVWYFETKIVTCLKELYGLEDPEQDYSAHRCSTLIYKDRPKKATQVHGCPFSVLPKPELKVYLKAMRRKIKHAEIEDLANYLPENPQFACLKFFNGQFHDSPLHPQKFNHPVDLLIESEARLRE